MWDVRRLAVRSNERAVANARGAAVELARLLIEREEVDLYLHDRYGDRYAEPARRGPEGRPA